MSQFDISAATVCEIVAAVYMPAGTVDGFVSTPNGSIKRFGPRKYHGLIYSKGGNSEYWVDDRLCMHSGSGQIVYLPEGRPYTVRSFEPADCWCINFHILEETPLEPLTVPARNPARWQELFVHAANHWTYRTPGWSARCHATLYSMLALLSDDLQSHYLPGNRVSVVRRVMHRYESQDLFFKDSVSVARIAEECNMSETYFRRLFREIYGETPVQYIREARFRRAKTLLESTTLPVASIAELSGFESLYHFSRAFHLHESMTPTDYRIWKSAAGTENRDT